LNPQQTILPVASSPQASPTSDTSRGGVVVVAVKVTGSAPSVRATSVFVPGCAPRVHSVVA
jgi:hypothetical protein